VLAIVPGAPVSAHKLGEWTPDDEAWHEARRFRVGGSDIGAVMNWSPFQTREDLRAEKLGTVTRRKSKAMARGNYLEPAIAAWLADELGITYDESYKGTWVDDEHDYALYNPDAVTTEPALCEFKSTAVRDAEHGWGRAGSANVPLMYAAQVQYGMGILGLSECHLAVISGAPKFEFAKYKLKFDPITFAYLRGQARKFIEQLQQGEAA
jgi:putative phage-type endonuclease